MPPNTTPNPAAIDTIQESTSSGVCEFGPSVASAQTRPVVVSQLNSRCRPIASTVISTNAMAIDRHRIERIGGDRICESALTAASSMTVYPLLLPARVRHAKGHRQGPLPEPCLTRFLYANRCPPRIKCGAGFRLKTLRIERLTP